MKKINWTPKLQKISSLKEWENNPRTITGEALERLKNRITERGFHDVVKVDSENVILSGTQRRKALEGLGITEVWTMVPDRKLTDRERKIIVLESNRNEGEDDWKKLKEYFAMDELLGGGFDKDEIAKYFDRMVEAKEDDFDADAEAARIKTPQTKVGDIWLLGDHRLICGDSTDPVVFSKLFEGGVKADMCWTDPPYNVDYDYTRKYTDGPNKFAGGTKIFNDKKTDAQFHDMLFAVLKNVYDFSVDSSGIYVSHATKTQEQFFGAFKEAGFHFSQTIIWLKERIIFALGQEYHRVYEPIIYGWKEGKKRWSNKLTSTTEKEVWDIDKATFEERLDVWYLHRDKSSDYIHPTQKPVRLPERAIKKSSPVGGIVVEPFCGSGSALMACEQLKRRCFAVELDPRYVDAICKRYATFTGKKPVTVDGKEFVI